jgi:hypothetical protein
MSKSRIKICFTTQEAHLCSKAHLYPGFTHFRGILSLIQVHIFVTYVKFCVFDTHHEGVFNKYFWTPLMCPYGFFGRARAFARLKYFFAGFTCFTSKWNCCRVTEHKNKIFIKINSPYGALRSSPFCYVTDSYWCILWETKLYISIKLLFMFYRY